MCPINGELQHQVMQRRLPRSIKIDILNIIRCKNGNCNDQFVVAAAFPSKWERYWPCLLLMSPPSNHFIVYFRNQHMQDSLKRRHCGSRELLTGCSSATELYLSSSMFSSQRRWKTLRVQNLVTTELYSYYKNSIKA